MRKKSLLLLITLLISVFPLLADIPNRPLNTTLLELMHELQGSYSKMPKSQKHFDKQDSLRNQALIDAVTLSNDLSIRLYTQEQYMTFNLAYVLKKVSSEYKSFHSSRLPYDQSLNEMSYGIDRYARLIESLRRLPPQMKEIHSTIVPDSLLYHNDSLDLHLAHDNNSLEKEIIRIVKDTASAVFMLDESGQALRDSCIFYASELLKMYASNRSLLLRDSSHYQETYLRMKENYDYAQGCYRDLQKYVFVEGQLPFYDLVGNFNLFLTTLKSDLTKQYDFRIMTSSEDAKMRLEEMSSKATNVVLIVACVFQLLMLFIFWAIIYIISRIILRFVKTKRVTKKQLPLFSLFTSTVLYILIYSNIWSDYEYIQMGVRNINTFLWLLMAFAASMLLRVKPDQIRHSVLLYQPIFIIAFVIIVARNTFIPDSLLVFLLPPLLFLIILRQLFVCLYLKNKATSVDMRLGWASLVIYAVAFVFAFLGYTFVCLLILIWWYFQLAVLLTVVCVASLLDSYKQKRLDKRVNAMRERITYVSGDSRESLLFGATWLYDLIRQVGIPVMIIFSLPFCAHLSLNIFDFNDLFTQYYTNPFICINGENGIQTMCISAQSIVYLLTLFFVLRYLNKAVHAGWQYARYSLFMRVHNRKTIRTNEINLSLGNSIITVLIWFIFTVVVVIEWKIPTGSLGLVAGGLSAGIGLALKDILNNFIYGIQLMGGRLRVGDWIECEGVRGKVTAINYQCVQVETLDGTEMSFLNSSLFGKNFNNLTRNNSYERVKVFVGVAYGTDIQKVRNVLVRAMEQMRTKDLYGREVVEPNYGIKVMINEMSDSAVEIAVTQFVLVAERLPYVDKAKEVVYNALNQAGITIPFPQCDVHII